MSKHEYTAGQALELLLGKLNERDETLAAHVRSAIDAGKDVKQRAPVRGRRRKQRVYRKAVPFTEEEALGVALDALQAYFVEQPLFINSAAQDFRTAVVREEREGRLRDRQAESAKILEVAVETETQLSPAPQPTVRLSPVPAEHVEEQLGNIRRLRDLLDFDGG
jgi:hypothetical protein